MSRLTLIKSVLAFCVLGFAALAVAKTVEFKVPGGALKAALDTYVKQAGVQLVYREEDVKGQKTVGVKGALSPEEALSKILAGTQLVVHRDLSGAVAIVLAESAVDISAPNSFDLNDAVHLARHSEMQQVEGETRQSKETLRQQTTLRHDDPQIQEVVVTGSNIRGSQSSSPLVIIDKEEMRLSGHANLGDVIRALPQNFSGGQNPGVIGTGLGGDLSNTNITGGSSLNLRGLGPDATLTLLNGSRLPFDGVFQATDVTVVPAAAIDRIEVLLDGASAIYGSDAVAGVANIILQRDYEGLELSARYGSATDGGNDQTEFTAVGGKQWATGGFLASIDVADTSMVRAGQRDHLSYLPSEATVYPKITQKGALLTGHQQLGGWGELSFDAFYTERETLTTGESSASFVVISKPGNKTWGASPSLSVKLPQQWSMRLRGFIGGDRTDRQQDAFLAGAPLFSVPFDYNNKAKSVEAGVEGPFASLPGGKARAAFGLGYRENSLNAVDKSTGIDVNNGGSSDTYHLYGEINLPIISSGQNIPAVDHLSFNGALRYEDYGSDDFGSITTPKAGMVWGITRALDFKASWGKSFKAPTLRDRFSFVDLTLYPASRFVTGAPAGSTVLYTVGGDRNLKPERAEILTAGFTIHPESAPEATFELGWFHVDYTDRVVKPINPTFQALTNPAFSEFVIRNPSVQDQNSLISIATPMVRSGGAVYNPATVIAIANNRQANASKQTAEGVDVSASYAKNLQNGSITVSLSSSWLTSDRMLTALSPEIATAGVIYFPAKFRARTGFVWSRNAFTLASYVNHIGSVKNTNISTGVKGGSMTTLDTIVDYEGQSGVLAGFGLNLAVTNAFNKQPPYLPPLNSFSFDYDWTNYSAIGRVVSVTATKKFK